MSLPPHLQALVAAEEGARALAWLNVAPDLCGVPICHLTPRARNDLVLAGNAFFTGSRPVFNDLFNFLWRLSPYYRQPTAPRLVLQARRLSPLRRFLVLWLGFGSRVTARRFLALERHVAALDLPAATAAIIDYLLRTFQDRPAGDEEDGKSAAAKPSLLPPSRPHWLDDVVVFFITRTGMSVDEVLDAPFQRLLQIHRAYEIAHGARPIDPSSAAIADWIFEEADRLRAAGVMP